MTKSDKKKCKDQNEKKVQKIGSKTVFTSKKLKLKEKTKLLTNMFKVYKKSHH